MKRVMFVIESLSGGGAEKVLSTLVRHLDRQQLHVTVCPIVDTGQWVDEVRRYADYRPVIRRPGRSPLSRLWYQLKYRLVYSWLPLRWVCCLWLPHDSDIEVAFCEGFATRLMAHSSNRRARRLAWVHCDLHNFHWTRSVYRDDNEETWCYNQYDHIAAVSQTATLAFRQELPGVTSPCVTLYNPIDSDEIQRKATQAPSGAPHLTQSKEKTIRLITAGRFIPAKGFDRLLRIVKTLRDEGRPVELWMLGDGQLRGQYEQYIADNHLEDIVTLWGFQPNPYTFIAHSDLFVCSSIAEGYSLVIAESLVLGIPVISTDCAGPNELLDNGTYGLLTSNDETSLLNDIRQLLNHPDQLAHYRQQARHRGDTFAIAVTVQAIEQTIMR